MNKVLLVGRIATDLELKKNSQGISFCRFNLAVDDSYTDKTTGEKVKKTDFLTCMVSRETAENLCKYQKKGKLISIEGKLHAYSYDKSDGTKGYAVDVVVQKLSYLESKPKDERPEPIFDDAQPVATQVTQQDPFAEFGEEMKNLEFPFDANIEVDPEHRPW